MGLFNKSKKNQAPTSTTNTQNTSQPMPSIATKVNKKAKGSITARVIREKRKIETRARNKKTSELNEIKSDALFRARMVKQLQEIDTLLEDDAVYSVTVEVAERDLSAFIKAIYREEMGAYDISQVDDYSFEIAKKEIYI